MRVSAIFAACLLLSFAGCTSLPFQEDVFEGTYTFLDPREKGSLVVAAAGLGKWTVQISQPGEQPRTHPLSEGAPLILASRDVLEAVFVSPTPIDKLSCLASSGRYQIPLICRLPINTEYKLAGAMKPGHRPKSFYGYVFIVGTPAGALAAELRRTPGVFTRAQPNRSFQRTPDGDA